MRFLLQLAIVVVLCPASLVRADEASAKRHYEAGVKAYNLQRFDLALKEFQAAYEERDDAAFLFNIAQAQRQIGQYDSAARSYRAYLHQQPDARNRDEVTKLIADMEQAMRDKRANEPPTGTQPPVEAPATTTPAPAQTPISTAFIEYRDGGRSKRVAGIALVGVGIGVVALGVVFAVLSKQAGDAAYRPASGTYDFAADDRQRNYRAADIACFAVGGAAVVAGTTVWILGHRDRRQRVSAGAGVLPGFAYASVKVGF
jgi:tetratricopeptide (TPR) repeat protein